MRSRRSSASIAACPRSISRQVLASRPDGLAVLPVRGVHWDDLGDPERVMATRRRTQSIAMLESIPA
jgi:hypothetical protein